MGNIGDLKKAVWFYPTLTFMDFNPSQRWGHSACFSNGFLYIFGGCCGGLHFSDVLVLNLETMSWTNLATTGVGPGPRDSHSAVIVGHMMIVFGGTNGSKKVNDVHILDLLTHEWTRPNCKGVVPTPRESHTATMVGNDRLVVFGGSGEGDANYLNDLHILDLKTMKWSSPEPKGDVPMPRDSHIAVCVDNKIFVYGGDCGDRYRGDVDVFDVDTLTWSKFLLQGPSPGVRAGHAAVTIGSKVYMIGGVGDKQYYNDVWVLDTITCSWTLIEVRGQQPQGRFSHTAIAIDSDIAIYGGCGEDERPLNELLILQLGLAVPDDRYHKMFASKCNQSKRHFLHDYQTNIKLGPPLTYTDQMHMSRRRKLNSKACEVIESEPEEHSLSLSQNSSPSHSDQERPLVKKPFNSTPQVLPLFNNHNQISSSCKQIPGTQSNPIMVQSRTTPDPDFIQQQSHHYKHHQTGIATQVEHRNMGDQNLIGAEVHGKVDGEFDSGYLMTATVNGQIFRGVLFPPGPEVVSRGAFRGHNRRSPTCPMAQKNLHINQALVRHSNGRPSHASEASHHGYHQDPHVHRPPSVIRSVPPLSFGIEQVKVQNELHGVVLTLGGPGSA